MISIVDSYGQLVDTGSDSSAYIDVSIPEASPGVPADAYTSGGIQAQASGGIATFSGLKLRGISGISGTDYSLLFNSLDLASSVTALYDPITLLPGALDHFAMSTNNIGSVVAGDIVTIEAQGQDIDDNDVQVAGTTVSWSETAVGGGTQTEIGSFSGDASSTTGAGGMASIFFTTNTQSHISTEIHASANSGAVLGTTDTITTTWGSASSAAVTVDPAGARSGVELTTQPVIEMQDAHGNVVENYVATEVNVTSTDPDLAISYSVTTSVNGVATFTNLKLTGPAKTYTVRFDFNGFTVDKLVTLAYGSVDHLTVTSQPTHIYNQITMGAVTVEARDSADNLVEDFTGRINASETSSFGDLIPGTLGANNYTSAVAGVATFSSLNFDANRIASDDLLIDFALNSDPAIVGQSAAMGIYGGAVASLTFAEIPTAVNSGSSFLSSVEVQALDADGFNADYFEGEVTLSLNGSNGTVLAGTLTQANDLALPFSQTTDPGHYTRGNFIFPGLSLTGSAISVGAGNYTLHAEVATNSAIFADSDNIRLDVAPEVEVQHGIGSDSVVTDTTATFAADIITHDSQSTTTVDYCVALEPAFTDCSLYVTSPEYFDGSTWQPTPIPADGTDSVVKTRTVLTGLDPGTELYVRVLANNGVSMRGDTWRFTTAPTLTAVNPANGVVTGGEVITLTGSGFTEFGGVLTNPTSVTIDGEAATDLTYINATTIEVTTPAAVTGSIGTAVDIVASNADASSTFADAFTYYDAPTVTDVTTSGGTLDSTHTGYAAGGDTVVITGTGFLDTAEGVTGSAKPRVWFGTTEVISANIAVDSATQITVTSPAHVVGAVAVRVMNWDTQEGTKSTAFTYVHGAPDHMVLTWTDSSPPTAGQVDVNLSPQPIIEIVDSYGQRVTSGAGSNAWIDVEVTGSALAYTAGGNSVQATNGLATFSTLKLRGQSGNSYSLNFYSADLDSTINKAYSSIVLSAGSLDHFDVTPLVVVEESPPILVTAGDAFQVWAQAKDIDGNNVDTGAITIDWSEESAAGGFQATGTFQDITDHSALTTPYQSETTSSGLAKVWFTPNTAADTDAKIRATGATKTGISELIRTTFGAVDHWVVTTNNVGDPVAGSQITASAQAQDIYNNDVKVAGLSVSWAESQADGSVLIPTTGSFPGSNPTSTDADGVATVLFDTSTTAEDTTWIRANGESASGVSDAVTTTFGAPSYITVTPDTSDDYAAGSVVAVSAQVYDVYDNKVKQAITINWSELQTGSLHGDFYANYVSDPTSTITQSTTNSTGLATADFRTSETSGVNTAVRATWVDITDPSGESNATGLSADINTVPGEVAKIEVVEGDTQTGTVGQALATALKVRLLDTYDNPVPGYTSLIPGESVLFAPATGDGSVGTVSDNLDGTYSVSWTLGTTKGSQSLTASANGQSIGFTATGT
ncbi:MAG: hypothetical protein F2839_05585, partial [Actinobacteria bacterium]|nr:hypothetical protein [Actinomycetota bacterium]